MSYEITWRYTFDDDTSYQITLSFENISLFSKFVIQAMNEVMIRYGLTLNEPSDLLTVFEKGSEEPDIIFKYNRIRYSTNKFFNSIPDETKDLIISPDIPTGSSQVEFRQEFIDRLDNLIDYIIYHYTYNDVPRDVQFSLAKFIVLMYIDIAVNILDNQMEPIVRNLQNGDDPERYRMHGINGHIRFREFIGEEPQFNINKFIIKSILNTFRVTDVDQIYIDYVESLPYETISSIADYTHLNYRDINSFLRKGRLHGTQDDEWLAEVKKDIQNIDQAFLNAPPLQEPITLYRGQKREVSDGKSYTSTTTDISITLVDDFLDLVNEACCLYVITAVPGSKILPIMTISHVEEEEEVLLDKNAKYIITNIDRKEYTVKDASSGRVKHETRTIRTIYVTYMPGDSQMLPPPVYTNSEDENSEDEYTEEEDL